MFVVSRLKNMTAISSGIRCRKCLTTYSHSYYYKWILLTLVKRSFRMNAFLLLSPTFKKNKILKIFLRYNNQTWKIEFTTKTLLLRQRLKFVYLHFCKAVGISVCKYVWKKFRSIRQLSTGWSLLQYQNLWNIWTSYPKNNCKQCMKTVDSIFARSKNTIIEKHWNDCCNWCHAMYVFFDKKEFQSYF